MPSFPRLPAEQVLEICDLFNNGVRPQDIAQTHQLETRHVFHVLKEAGIVVGQHRPSILDRYSAQTLDDLVIDYKDGQLSMKRLCAKYDITSHQLYAILAELGVALRSYDPMLREGSKLRRLAVVSMYQAGATYEQITNETGYQTSDIPRILREEGTDTDRFK